MCHIHSSFFLPRTSADPKHEVSGRKLIIYPLPWLSSNCGQIKSSRNEQTADTAGSCWVSLWPGYRECQRNSGCAWWCVGWPRLCLWCSSADCAWPCPRELGWRWNQPGSAGLQQPGAGLGCASLPQLLQHSWCLCSTSSSDGSRLTANCCFIGGSLPSSSSLNWFTAIKSLQR